MTHKHLTGTRPAAWRSSGRFLHLIAPLRAASSQRCWPYGTSASWFLMVRASSRAGPSNLCCACSICRYSALTFSRFPGHWCPGKRGTIFQGGGDLRARVPGGRSRCGGPAIRFGVDVVRQRPRDAAAALLRRCAGLLVPTIALGRSGCGGRESTRPFVPMARSQMAFIRGVLGKVVMTRSPSALNTSSNAVVKSGSRSWITNRSAPGPSSSSMARLRACCTAHAPVGCAVTPARCSLRVPCSMDTSTYNRLSSAVPPPGSHRR